MAHEPRTHSRPLLAVALGLILALPAAGGAYAASDDEETSSSGSIPGSAAPEIAFEAAAAGHASYYPSGPQLNVPQADLTGWELCYTDVYATSYVNLYGPGGILEELCTGDYLLLAGSPVESTTLSLLAAAPREDVLFETPADSSTVHVANGTAWYFNDDWSWGFLLPGDAVSKNECDTEDSGANDLRLCWHVFDQQLVFGYRLGAIQGLNGSTEYQRYIYHAASVPSAEEPAEEPEEELVATGAESAEAAAITGGVLLLAGAALLTARLARRRHAS